MFLIIFSYMRVKTVQKRSCGVQMSRAFSSWDRAVECRTTPAHLIPVLLASWWENNSATEFISNVFTDTHWQNDAEQIYVQYVLCKLLIFIDDERIIVKINRLDHRKILHFILLHVVKVDGVFTGRLWKVSWLIMLWCLTCWVKSIWKVFQTPCEKRFYICCLLKWAEMDT